MMLRIILLLSNFLFFYQSVSANSESRILVYSWSSEDYVRNIDELGNPLPEICAFLEGNYYPEVTKVEIPVEPVAAGTQPTLSNKFRNASETISR